MNLEDIMPALLASLFGIVGLMGVYIFFEEKRYVRSRFDIIEKDISKDKEDTAKEISIIKESSKELSRQEFDEIKGYVKDSIDTVLGSQKFRDDLKKGVRECMLHFEKNRSAAEAGMFEHFDSFLRSSMEKIMNEINEIKQR